MEVQLFLQRIIQMKIMKIFFAESFMLLLIFVLSKLLHLHQEPNIDFIRNTRYFLKIVLILSRNMDGFSNVKIFKKYRFICSLKLNS